MKKLIIILIGIFFAALAAQAQQEFMITHYMHNGLFLNPAYAGSHEGLSASVLARKQWVGVDGAPTLQMASAHSPISYRNISLGGIFYRDNIGISTETGAQFSYAYRIQLNKKLKLSMGLQTLMRHYLIDYSRATTDMYDVGDPSLGSNSSEFKLNFGTGLFLHSERFYFGVSIPRIMNNKISLGDPDGMFSRTVRHYYLTAGYVFQVTEGLLVKPNILVKKSDSAPVQYDLNLNTLIKNVVWVGASYRSMESVDALLGIQITPQFLVNYSHDFTVNELSVSSHEIMISYVFERKNMKILTPRYF